MLCRWFGEVDENFQQTSRGEKIGTILIENLNTIIEYCIRTKEKQISANNKKEYCICVTQKIFSHVECVIDAAWSARTCICHVDLPRGLATWSE